MFSVAESIKKSLKKLSQRQHGPEVLMKEMSSEAKGWVLGFDSRYNRMQVGSFPKGIAVIKNYL